MNADSRIPFDGGGMGEGAEGTAAVLWCLENIPETFFH